RIIELKSDSTSWCETGDHRAEGTSAIWDESGHLLHVGQARAGRIVSSVMFYETGEIEAVRPGVPGDPVHEIGEMIFGDGTRKTSAEGSGEQLDGLSQPWYPDGRPQSEGRFVHGVQAGTWTLWGVDGTMKTVTPLSVDQPPAAPAP